MKVIPLGNGYAVTKKKKIIMITDNRDDAIKILNGVKKAKKILKVIK